MGEIDNQIIYTPILKAKQGECRAIKELTSEIRKRIQPFFEVPRLAIDFNTKKKIKTPEAHLATVFKNISKSWERNEHTPFLDIYDVPLEIRTSSGKHLWEFADELSGINNYPVIPVTGLERDASYNNAISKLSTLKHTGLGIRLFEQDLVGRNFQKDLKDLSDHFGLSPSMITLIIDLRSITEDASSALYSSMKSFLTNSRNTSQWKSIILSGSSFPQYLSEVKSNTTDSIPRVEFDLWQLLLADKDQFQKLPRFSDYSIVNPVMEDLDPRKISPTAKIRYTTDDSWLIFKGHSLKKTDKRPEGFSQYYSLASEIVKHNDFLGSRYSWGDSKIEECAVSKNGTGNLTTWISIDTNHHITYVCNQISSLLSL